MRALGRLSLFVVALVGTSAFAAADELGVGARVRVAGQGVAEGAREAPVVGLVTGRVVAMDDDSLLVERADGSRVAFRQEGVRFLQTSGGRRSRIGEGLRGALVMGAVGAGVGLVVGPPEELEPAGRGKAVGYYALNGALFGFTMGVILPGEHWSDVDIGGARVEIAPTTGPRGRGAGLAVSVGF